MLDYKIEQTTQKNKIRIKNSQPKNYQKSSQCRKSRHNKRKLLEGQGYNK